MDEGDVQYPPHPAVNWTKIKLRPATGRGYRRSVVEVTCPSCKHPRWAEASRTRKWINWGLYTGYCRKCQAKAKPLERQLAQAPVDHDDCGSETFDMGWGSGYLTGEGRRRLAGLPSRYTEDEDPFY